MPNVEIDSATGLTMARPRRALQMMVRALTLRCPNCGGRRVMKHWLKMRERCGRCGIRIERGERDYFLGAMMWNLVMGEFLCIGVIVVVMIARWPDVPWDFLQIGVPALAILCPVLLFPFSKLVWLAFDLMLRPLTKAEMEWHERGGSDSFWRPPAR